MALDKNGYEVLDDTPRAIPLKFRRQSFVDQIQSFIRAELSRQADSQGHETFEESDDFWIDDDDTLPRTAYELDDDQLVYAPEPEPAVEPGSATPAPDPATPAPEPGSAAG